MTVNMNWMQRNFEEFCSSISLHGYAYLVIVKPLIGKIIWSLIVTAMSILGATFLVINTQEFIDSGMITTIESSTASVEVNDLVSKVMNKYIILNVF